MKSKTLFAIAWFFASLCAHADEFTGLFRLLEEPIGRYVMTQTPAGRQLAEQLLDIAGAEGVSLNNPDWYTALRHPGIAKMAPQLEARLEFIRGAFLESEPLELDAYLNASADSNLAFSYRPRGGLRFVAEAAPPESFRATREKFLADTDVRTRILENVRTKRPMGGARLVGADLSKTSFNYVREFMGAKLSLTSFREANLQSVDFEGADLSFSDFRNAKLFWTRFDGVNLRGANFRGADLQKVSFEGADLTGARFEGAKCDVNTLRDNGWTRAYAKSLGMEVEWWDSESERIFNLLNRPMHSARRLAVKLRWKVLSSLAKRYDWMELLDMRGTDPRAENFHKSFRAITQARIEPSGTLMGENGARPGTDGKTIARKNLDESDELIDGWIRRSEPITLERIKQINRVLGEGLHNNERSPGELRDFEIYGSGMRYLGRADVPGAMDDLMTWLAANQGKMHPIELAAGAYQRLVTIHPFPDANGRTSRAVMDWILQMNGYPPASFASQEDAMVAIFSGKTDAKNFTPDDAVEKVTRAVENSFYFLSHPNARVN